MGGGHQSACPFGCVSVYLSVMTNYWLSLDSHLVSQHEIIHLYSLLQVDLSSLLRALFIVLPSFLNPTSLLRALSIVHASFFNPTSLLRASLILLYSEVLKSYFFTPCFFYSTSLLRASSILVLYSGFLLS